MNTKHTPGPWHRSGNATYPIYAGETTETFVHLAGALNIDNDAEREANCSLIAAAPELLEACKALLALVPRDKLHPFGYTDEPQDKANDLARNAIAKAERY